MFFSVIIPVYNRPKELHELLNSLTGQLFDDFEVIIIEDGSDLKSENLIADFSSSLNIKYYYQANQGQGFARNTGVKMATGHYFVFFDSDCIIPPTYFTTLYKAILERKLDAFGGPDAAEDSFSVLQKAIDFSMTSFWTTGGIRGKGSAPAKYQARGFNMGFSRNVYDEVGGFLDPNKGEDIEISIRIRKAGFKLELIEEAFVYHKRRNTLASFFRQSFSFGQNRVNVARFHPGAIKLVHLMPLAFFLGLLALLGTYLFNLSIFSLFLGLYLVWSIGLFISALTASKSIAVAALALVTSYGQLISYGIGLLLALIRR
ncbi:glycosyl transferase [Echinicola pacifica]|uniref:Glycosyl transferase n=1 Tax=Echinicola pacifica TaxID=346377 RepID=A0A918QFF3_9BACT|nr:glycosyltransferase [Echinicola pacifica]GGZ41651.1 glycosyl transferase [Echinicola pacifica]